MKTIPDGRKVDSTMVGEWEAGVVRPKASRQRAFDLRSQAADRLGEMLGDGFQGRGVESTDPLKRGVLTPGMRVRALLSRVAGLKARLEAEEAREEEARPKVMRELYDRISDAKSEALSIWRDMEPGEGDEGLALEVVATLG